MDIGKHTQLLAAAAGDCSELIVAYSGGADSTLCLHLALTIAEANQKVFVTAWYCHHYREAITPERRSVFAAIQSLGNKKLGNRFRFVADVADVSLVATRLGYSWEHTASLLRRKRLLRLQNYPYSVVITGHNASDYGETLALRMLRKIPPNGFPEQSIRAGDTGFLRPLFDLRREQVRLAVLSIGLPVYEDPENDNTTFARNQIRKQGIPRDLKANAAETVAATRIPFTVKSRRELTISYAEWKKLAGTDCARLQYQAFRRLAIVRKFTRGDFLRAKKLPFSIPPFFSHREKTNDNDQVIFRRGLGVSATLPVRTDKHTLRGNEITRAVKMTMPYGRKSLSKIFSERHLSPRQRRQTLVQLSAADPKLATQIIFPAGMP